jgi:DNA-binding GntR family transcriptional regulator
VRHAAEKFTEDDATFARAKLEEHVKAYRSRDPRQLWATHTAFHFALYDAARSRWMSRLIKPLWESSERYRFAVLPMRMNVERRRLEHVRILNACAGHEPDVAAMELHNHLARTANLISGQMGGSTLFELLDAPVTDDDVSVLAPMGS